MKARLLLALATLLLIVNVVVILALRNAFSADFTALTITPQHVGVFIKNNEQQYTATATLAGGTTQDVTNQVDWYIEENGFDDQPLAEETATIDQEGRAEGLSNWGRVNISACYPRGCKIPVEPPPPPPEPEPTTDFLPSLYHMLFLSDAEAAAPVLLTVYDTADVVSATTTMTLMDIVSWRAPDNRDKAIASMPVVTPITFVSIAYNRITWTWENGFDGLLWAFYSDDDNKTYKAWGWDYVTKHHYLKSLEGYPRGWVGTAIGSCGACNGYPQATTVYFTQTY